MKTAMCSMTSAMWHSHPPWVATKQPQETTSCTVPDMTSPTCVKPCLTTYCICSFCGSIEGMYEYGMGVRKQHNTKRLRARPKNATSLQMSRLDRTAFAVPSDLHKKNGQTGMIVRCQVWPILKSLYHGLLPKKKAQGLIQQYRPFDCVKPFSQNADVISWTTLIPL